MTQDRPNINSTLNSLKSAMNAEEDQVLEEEYIEPLTAELESSVSDNAVEAAVYEVEHVQDDEDAVFSSEDEVLLKKTVKTEPSKPEKPFVLTRMIQDDGSVINLELEEDDRPNIGMSEEKIEGIVREEAKSILKTWIDNNMYNILKNRKAG